MLTMHFSEHKLVVSVIYRKRRNIGGTFNLAIENKIAKLKTANILAYVHNVIETEYATAKLKIRQYFIFGGF